MRRGKARGGQQPALVHNPPRHAQQSHPHKRTWLCEMSSVSRVRFARSSSAASLPPLGPIEHVETSSVSRLLFPRRPSARPAMPPSPSLFLPAGMGDLGD